MNSAEVPRKKQGPIRKLIFLLILLLLATVGVELVVRGWQAARGKPFRVSEIRSEILGEVRAMVDIAPGEGGDSAPGDTLPGRLHPYYGYCRTDGIDRVIRYLGEQKTDQDYCVLIVGGSVAAGFGNKGRRRLERVLKADPVLTGRRIRILNCGHGAFKQPQQLMIVAYFLSLGLRWDAVVNLDGFNEIAVANNNAKLGVHPVHPAIAQWGRVARGQTLPEQAIDSLVLMKGQRDEANRIARRSLGLGFHRSVILGNLALARVRRMRSAWAEAYEQYLGFLVGPGADEAFAGPEFDPDLEPSLQISIRNWVDSSLSIHALCESRGIAYLHVLQPTLYDRGSKPLTQEEITKGGAYLPWLEVVGPGYPRLREAGEALQRAGVHFLDASMTFQNVEETLYFDACHFERPGHEILAERVGEELLGSLVPARRE